MGGAAPCAFVFLTRRGSVLCTTCARHSACMHTMLISGHPAAQVRRLRRMTLPEFRSMMARTVQSDGSSRLRQCVSTHKIPDVPSEALRSEIVTVPEEHRHSIGLKAFTLQQELAMLLRDCGRWGPPGLAQPPPTRVPFSLPPRVLCENTASTPLEGAAEPTVASREPSASPAPVVLQEPCECHRDSSQCKGAALFTRSGVQYVLVCRRGVDGGLASNYDGNADGILNQDGKYLFCWNVLRDFWSTLSVSAWCPPAAHSLAHTRASTSPANKS